MFAPHESRPIQQLQSRASKVKWRTLVSWYSHGVTSLEVIGVRGLEKLAGELGRLLTSLTELLRFLARSRCDCGSFGILASGGRLTSEFCLESMPGKSSPKKPCNFFMFWKPRPTLDLDPELLTVVALATDGRLSSPGYGASPPYCELPGLKPGESDTSSDESLKKLPKTLVGMTTFCAHGGLLFGDTAVGGCFDIEGILLEEVSRARSSFR
jgi:hypothetical protein